jgi:hypothetical protein
MACATIADHDLFRDGPFCDRIEGKQRYVDFLRNVITSLKDYELKVQRVSHVSDPVSFVELSETFQVDGVRTEYPESILFERNDGGLISHVSVFMKQPGGRGRWRALGPPDRQFKTPGSRRSSRRAIASNSPVNG